MVSKASEDLPDPERPVKTTSLSRGMVRLTSFRLCSRAPRMTIWVCGEPISGMDSPSYPSAGPAQTRLGRRGRREPLAVFQGVPAKSDQPVAQLGGPLELQVTRRLFHLSFQVLDQPLDLIRRESRRDRGNRVLHGLRLLALQVVDSLDDGGRRDPVLFVVGRLQRPPPVGLVDGPLH